MAGRPPYPNQRPPYPGSGSPYPPSPHHQYQQQQSYLGQNPQSQSYSAQPGYQQGYTRPPSNPTPYGTQQFQQHQQFPSSSSQYQQNTGYGYQQGGGGGYQQPPPQGGFPPQQGGYGAPPQQQGGYGQPPQIAQAGPAQIQGYKNLLTKCVQENNLQSFYPPNSPALDQIANKAASQIPGLAQRWRIDMEIAKELVQLGLYDIVIFIDDSGSMAFEENGERIKDLSLILERVASTATVFDEDGISLRFMNASVQFDNIRTEEQVKRSIDQIQYKGLTPMGTELKRKVIDGMIVPKLQRNQYTKPHLVIVITDGQPAGEAPNAVFDAIKYANQEVSRSRGPGGVAFQFAQVGNDQKAREFLSKLDEDPTVGGLVDCTSNFENESDEMRKKGVDLTPDLWLVKLMLGAIDRSYDSKDEGPPGAGGVQQGQFGAPPGQYGARPQGQQYGGPPQGPPQGQQYGAPPQGQYGAPPGGQYGGGGGYGQQPPQQGYGRGSGPGGYPPQGGQGNTRY